MTNAEATLAGTTCYLSLGSNVGERERHVLDAMGLVESSGAGRVVAASSLYETDPVGMPGAAAFINAVVEVETSLSPGGLLERLRAVEDRMGRTGGHCEPREIDIDIVTFGENVIDQPRLTVPHPRYASRRFVLVPLQEVAPGFVCPCTDVPVATMLAEAGTAGVTRVSGRRVEPAERR